MHELPATQGLLDVALDAARQAGAHRVTGIDLVIGELSSIVDDSVQFYFDILSRDTPAFGAELHIRREPGEATCFDCGAQYEVRPPLEQVCRICGGYAVGVSGGQQFMIESIEVEDESPGGD